VELPFEEEYDEKVVRLPETSKCRSTDFLSGKEYHDGERNGHDPTSITGTRGEFAEKKARIR